MLYIFFAFTQKSNFITKTWWAGRIPLYSLWQSVVGDLAPGWVTWQKRPHCNPSEQSDRTFLNWDWGEPAANLHCTACEEKESGRLAVPRAGNVMQTQGPHTEIPSQQRLPKSATAFPAQGPRPRLAAPLILSLSSAAAHRRARERGSASQLCLS